MQQLGRHFDLVTNSAEHMDMVNQALVNSGENPLFSETLISEFAAGTDPYKYPNTCLLYTSVANRGRSPPNSLFLIISMI